MKAKIYSITAVIFLILFFTSCGKKENTTFSIEGKLDHVLPDQQVVLNLPDLQQRKNTPIDTLVINADGTFKSNYELQPGVYLINVYDSVKFHIAANMGDQIKINVPPNFDKKHITIEGSKDTDLLSQYDEYRANLLNETIRKARKVLKEASDNNDEEEIAKASAYLSENVLIYRKKLTEFINANLKNSIALYYTSTRWEGEDELPVLDVLVNNFEQKYPDLRITKLMRERLEGFKSTSIGSVAPEISLPGINGEEQSLFDLRGKYVLVDFWASWCPPCRHEAPVLVNIYNKYKDKGFEIFSVSMDKNEPAWKKASVVDGIIWPNVSNLKGWDDKNSPVHKYEVTDIPNNFLIDPDGVIIAKRLRGEELDKKLSEIIL